MAREAGRSTKRSPDPKERGRFVPDPKFVQSELEGHAKLLLSAVMSPPMMMAGMNALTSFRRAVELGLRHGPQDPRVRTAVREAERSLLTAIQEAASAMILELGETPKGPKTGPTAAGNADEDTLVEVPVVRATGEQPHVPSRERGSDAVARKRKRRA